MREGVIALVFLISYVEVEAEAAEVDRSNEEAICLVGRAVHFLENALELRGDF